MTDEVFINFTSSLIKRMGNEEWISRFTAQCAEVPNTEHSAWLHVLCSSP